MTKKLYVSLSFLVLLAMLLSAFSMPVALSLPAQASATPAAQQTGVDVKALMTKVVADIPADKGYGGVAPAKVNEMLADKPPFILDVREAAELEKEGYIKGAVNVPLRTLFKNLDKLPALDKPIVVYCAVGYRGAIAMAGLRMAGYTNVTSMSGGFGAWVKASYAVEKAKLEAPKAGTAPVVDKAVLEALDKWFSAIPEGFMSTQPAALNEALAGDKKPFVLDIRTAAEVEKNGYIAGSVNMPLETLFANLDKLPAKDTAIVMYCGSGHRGGIAIVGLSMLGYSKITNLSGGITAWKTAQLPVAGVVDWNVVLGKFLAGLPKDYMTVTATDLNAALGTDKKPFMLDVREAAELEKDGYIEGAVHIAVRQVLKNLDKLPAQDKAIVVYCASGHRGAFITEALTLLGYKDVKNLAGGSNGWKASKLAVKTGIPEAAKAGTAPKVDETMLKQLDAYLSALPDGFYSTTPAKLNTDLSEGKTPFLLDVRTADEYAKDGIIKGAVNAPINDLFTKLDVLPKDKAAAIVVICKSGHRAGLGTMALRMIGYTNVSNLGGGMNAWVAAQLPVEKK